MEQFLAVQLLQVFAHDDGALDEQPGKADRVRAHLVRLVDNRLDRLLDADVVGGVAVVREDDIDKVLADVVDIPAHGGKDNAALAGAVGLLHVRLQVGDRGLHRLRALEDEGELHLAATKEFADDAHAVQQVLVDDRQRVHFAERLIEVEVDAPAVAIDDARLQPLLYRQQRAIDLGCLLCFHAFEKREEVGERVVAVLAVLIRRAAAVVDQVERRVQLLFRDAVERHDLLRVDDCGVQPVFDRFEKEDRIEHAPGGGLQSERDIGDAKDGVHFRQFELELLNRVERLHGVAAQVLLAAGEGKGETIEEQITGLHAMAVDREVVDPVGDAQLPLGGARLAGLIDRQGHGGGTVTLDQRQHAADLAFPVLQVDGVDDRLAAVQFERRLNNRRLGAVEHQR